MALKIVQAGDPVLRQRAAPGVGLAAPPVGRSLQLAVIEDRAEYQKDIAKDQLLEREREPIPFHVLINPEIVRRSEESRIFFEGWLSLEGFCAMVPRSWSIRVDYIR